MVLPGSGGDAVVLPGSGASVERGDSVRVGAGSGCPEALDAGTGVSVSSEAEAVATITAAEPTASSVAAAILAIFALNVPSLNVTFRTTRMRSIRGGGCHELSSQPRRCDRLPTGADDRSGHMMTNPADAPLMPH
ncbi:hypothetical protein [Streptomyces atratus]|uniref:hypothetical protein n=1 Tax=Streptomyces atratus TaxID=1893 RepID=UPI0011610718